MFAIVHLAMESKAGSAYVAMLFIFRTCTGKAGKFYCCSRIYRESDYL